MMSSSVFMDAPCLRIRALVNLCVTIVSWLFVKCFVWHWLFVRFHVWRSPLGIGIAPFARDGNIELYCLTLIAFNAFTLHPAAEKWIPPKAAQTALLVLQVISLPLITITLMLEYRGPIV